MRLTALVAAAALVARARAHGGHAHEGHAHGDHGLGEPPVGLPAHACVHDALHGARAQPIAMRAQSYPPPPSLEKRAGGLSPSKGLAPLRIHVYDRFLQDDDGRTCHAQGEAFSIGGAPATGPECSPSTTEYCQGTCSSQFVLTAEKQRFLREDLIPELVATVRTMLSVVPVQGGLTLGGGRCGFYGGVRVPGNLTKAPGVDGADFVLFLTARPIYGDTIAYAGHCQTDQNGRPIAAHFNWSPSHFESQMTAQLRAYYLRVALHELTHALAFSPSLLADFPRGPDGRLTSLQMIPSWYGRQRAVVTPRVAAAARAHFDCDALQGAHLEDGGGTGSAGSHWESRLYRDEYMTAAASPGPRILSSLTLALFEDSGWYAVNASAAEPLPWGFRAGCKFVLQSCAQWPSIGTSTDGLELPPYTCGEATPDQCHYDHRAKAYCELKHYAALPAREQYFARDPTLGGYSEMLDFCPVLRAYSNGDCTDEANAPLARRKPMGFLDTDESDGARHAAFFSPLEVDADQYCAQCRCFESDIVGLTDPAASGGQRGHELRPGCFRMRCASDRALQVRVGDGRWVACPEAGGTVHVHGPDARARPHALKCPPAARLCALHKARWPRIDAVSPTRGPVSGGTRVTVLGSNLNASLDHLAVYVGDVPATEVRALSSTRLEFVTGARAHATARETVDVSVEDELGRSALQYDAFTYLPGWQPYAETVLIVLLVVGLTTWGVPRVVAPQMRAHALRVHSKRQAARRAAAAGSPGHGLEAGFRDGSGAPADALAPRDSALRSSAAGPSSSAAEPSRAAQPAEPQRRAEPPPSETQPHQSPRSAASAPTTTACASNKMAMH